MFEYYFYESNRDIVTENVVKCYSMISKYGFQPSMGKIKMVEGDDLKGEKLYKVSVIPKRNDKPLSITNFMVETEEVTNEEERKKSKISCRWTAPVNCYGDFGIRGQVYF